MRRAAWTDYFGAAGITPRMVEGANLIAIVGWFEIALGVVILALPVPAVLMFAFTWKVGSELLRPMAGEPFWEFVERGGSYAAPLALLYVQGWVGQGVEPDRAGRTRGRPTPDGVAPPSTAPSTAIPWP